MSAEKPTDIPITQIPPNFPLLSRKKQKDIERSVIGTLNETLAKAKECADNNLLTCVQQKQHQWKHLDLASRMLGLIGPQIEQYIEAPNKDEVEYSEERAGRSEKGVYTQKTVKTIHGNIRTKSLLVERYVKISREVADLTDSLGSTPDMPGGNGPIIEANITYNETQDAELAEFLEETE
jgi:hypothetical protein